MRRIAAGTAVMAGAALVIGLVGLAGAPAASAAPAPHIPSPGSSGVTPSSAGAPSRTLPVETSGVSKYCDGTAAGVKHIYVSISKQELWACLGMRLITSTLVTTGASALTNVHDATPTGTWRIYGKVQNTVLAGRDANGSWYDHVKYWIPFYRGYGFHDASWQTFPYGSSLYKTKGSHGCVHVPLSEISFLYNWAPIGTLVTIRS